MGLVLKMMTPQLAELTIKNGATIQLSKILKPIWIQSCFDWKAWCRVSYLTLHKIGYIITSKPIAIFRDVVSANGWFREAQDLLRTDRNGHSNEFALL